MKLHNAALRSHKLVLGGLLIAGLLMVGSTRGFSANKPETIEASAMGTGIQMGDHVGITPPTATVDLLRRSRDELIFLEFAIEGRAANAQQMSGYGAIALGIFERVHDGAALQLA
jgi:hypothetical protein